MKLHHVIVDELVFQQILSQLRSMHLLRSYRPSNSGEFSKMTNDFFITSFGSTLTAHNFLSFEGMDLKLHHVLVEKLVFATLFTELKLMH